MDIIKIVLLAIFTVITAVILKNYKPEYSILVILAVSLGFLFLGVSMFAQMGSQLEGIRFFYEENRHYYKVLFKMVGITYLCEFASGICRDAGYQSVAGQVELLGKIIILLSGLPVLLAIIETIVEYKI